MPVAFVFPENLHEVQLMIVPVITFLLGVWFLLFPYHALANTGLEARPGAPDAVGEGRATFAGALMAFGLCCLLLQEPKALQPGLNVALAGAWLVGALGYGMQILFGRARSLAGSLKFAVTLLIGILALWAADPVSIGLASPANAKEWAVFAIASLTFLLGMVALFLPTLALKIMRLSVSPGHETGVTEPRGLLAGLLVAAGLGVLIVREPLVAGIWLQLLLGALWLLTGAGRIVAMVLDPHFMGGFTRYHVMGTLFELALGLLVTGIVLGFV